MNAAVFSTVRVMDNVHPLAALRSKFFALPSLRTCLQNMARPLGPYRQPYAQRVRLPATTTGLRASGRLACGPGTIWAFNISLLLFLPATGSGRLLISRNRQ